MLVGIRLHSHDAKPSIRDSSAWKSCVTSVNRHHVRERREAWKSLEVLCTMQAHASVSLAPRLQPPRNWKGPALVGWHMHMSASPPCRCKSDLQSILHYAGATCTCPPRPRIYTRESVSRYAGASLAVHYSVCLVPAPTRGGAGSLAL